MAQASRLSGRSDAFNAGQDMYGVINPAARFPALRLSAALVAYSGSVSYLPELDVQDRQQGIFREAIRRAETNLRS